MYSDVASDLTQFGARVAGDVRDLGLECERTPPVLRQYNAWGERVDEIITCEAWKQQKKVSAEEGLIAIAYERKHQEWRYIYLQRSLPASAVAQLCGAVSQVGTHYPCYFIKYHQSISDFVHKTCKLQ